MNLLKFLSSPLIRKSKKLSILFLFICCFANNLYPLTPKENGSLTAFGYGVLDSVITESGQQIDIQVNWKSATWGIGCMVEVDSNVDISEVKEIRVRAFTDNGSKTDLYLTIETSDGASFAYPASLAKGVGDEPREFNFPLKKMLISKSDGSSPQDLKKTRGTYVSRVEIFFTKPKASDSAEEIVHVGMPELILSGSPARKVRSDDLEKAAPSPKAVPILEREKPLQKALLEDEEVYAVRQVSTNADLPLFSGNIELYEPFVVGTGVKDWGTVEQKDQMFVAVKWSQSAEGVAVRFKLPPKSSDQLLGMLKFDIRTAYDSRSDIQIRVISESGNTRNVYQDSKWRPKVTANWREYTFDFSGYISDRNFFEDDQPTSEFIEIMVRKPLPVIRTVRDHEIILIRNPRLLEFDPTLEKSDDTVEKEKFNFLKPFGKSISIYGDYVFDYSYNASGGIATGSSSRSFYDIGMIVDLKSMLGWDNGTAKVEFQKYEGDDAFDLVGDFQGTGSNDGDDVEILGELWVERFFLDNTLRIKVGKIDSNTEFAYVDNGVEFMNTSLSFASPTIFTLTTSPETAVGANMFLYPYENVYGGFGIYDGATQSGRSTGKSGLDSIFRDPGSLFIIGEVGGSWINKETQLQSRLGIGVWRHNANFERFDGGVENGAEGFYIVMDKSLWQRSTVNDDNRQSLDVFFQYGYASGTISEVEQHAGSGLVVSNPLGFRAEDISGLGLTWVDFTDAPEAGFDDSFELSFEYFYKFQCNSFLSVKADLQYVVNPGGDADLDNAFVPGLRVEASF